VCVSEWPTEQLHQMAEFDETSYDYSFTNIAEILLHKFQQLIIATRGMNHENLTTSNLGS
jgi:hypothetical protein